MLKLSTVKKKLKEAGHSVFSNDTKPYNLNIVGIRNKNRRANEYDDELHVFWKYNGQWSHIAFDSFTTDPGSTWLDKDRETAILKAGRYKYILGYHKGRELTLVQRVDPVKVYRDGNRDDILDMNEDTIEEGYLGINLHSGGGRFVDGWSAGCQVLHKRHFPIFQQLIIAASKNWGTTMTYTLLDG